MYGYGSFKIVSGIWENDIKMDLKEVEYHAVESIGLAADNDNTWAFAKLVVCFVFRKMC
jgi:hypothetical protein